MVAPVVGPVDVRMWPIGTHSRSCFPFPFVPRGFSSTAPAQALPEHKVLPMPALSPTMETGSISKWNLKEGDSFEVGTSICEVETDKATVSFDATDDGFVAKILVGEGGEIKVGDPILVTVEEQTDLAAFSKFSIAAAAPSAVPPAPVASTPVPAPAATFSPPVPQPASMSSMSGADAAAAGRVAASPLARRLAREAELGLAEVRATLQASGVAQQSSTGRLVAADVLRAASLPRATSRPAMATATGSPASSTAASISAAASTTATTTGGAQPQALPSLGGHMGQGGVFSDFQLSDTARAMAARQTYAKQVVPHYYLSVELNLSQLLEVRERFNQQLQGVNGKNEVGVELSVQDFLVKAAALAMQQVPDVNGAWMDSFIRRYEQVDINLVMGTGSFVATPVLRDVGSKGLLAIASEVLALEDTLFEEKEEGGTWELLNTDATALGTFSIHNLGIFGVKSAAPIVLTPQACALALGAIVDSVVPSKSSSSSSDEEGAAWEIAPMMTATLSCDHRVVDGAVGAQWLAAFKTLVENPISMLL